MSTFSKLELTRQEGKFQIEKTREAILDAAEKLFLAGGLEQVKMIDIAAGANITKTTLYRYFPDQPTIIFEIAVRMLKKIILASEVNPERSIVDNVKIAIINMIDQFYDLQDAFRFMGMFDHLYGENYPNEELASWYQQEIYKMGWGQTLAQMVEMGIDAGKIAMISNSTLSFLEKMAIRGNLIASEQGVVLDQELNFFKEMVNDYFDKIMLETNQ